MIKEDTFLNWALGIMLSLCILFFLGLVFCGVNYLYVIYTEGPVNHGLIVDKHYIPVHYSKIRIPEHWEVYVYGPHTKSNRKEIVSFRVSHENFDAYKIGEKFP